MMARITFWALLASAGVLLQAVEPRVALAQDLPQNLAENPTAPVGEIERQARFLGPAASYGAQRHVIVLIPRAAPGEARATGEALAARYDAALEASWPIVSLGETCFVLRVGEGVDPAVLSEQIEAEELVLLAYPIQRFSAQQTSFTDPMLPVQDALSAMRVDVAQALVTGRGVRLALVDTGVALDHPDISPLDLSWFDFIDGDTERLTPERHGTALASLIAAPGDGIGMVGVAPDVSLLALRACFEDASGEGSCNTFSLALALDHAIQAEADIVNLSIGGPSDKLLAALVGKAQEAGALVVAADSETKFPSGLPGVVAASDDPAAGVLTAPGLEVVGAAPGGAYDVYSGSSVAAAHISGIAALAWSSRPQAPASAVRAALGRDTADACRALAALDPNTACVD